MAGPHVVYLVWAPLGPEPLERFAASYRAHQSGLDHRLVLLLNGPRTDDFRTRCRSVGDSLDAELLELGKPVLDLDAYLQAAQRLSAETLCYLNSYSEILADRWLSALHGPISSSAAGLAGATGSYESLSATAPPLLRPLLSRRFPGFPNPHLRTNAFVLERQLLLSFNWPSSRRKFHALSLESGRHSLTRQTWDRGLEVVVVGRDGESYPSDRWPQSRTFRSGEQENLLVADNRTRDYAGADPGERSRLTHLTWG